MIIIIYRKYGNFLLKNKKLYVKRCPGHVCLSGVDIEYFKIWYFSIFKNLKIRILINRYII